MAHDVFAMNFGKIYGYYLQKIQKKGRTEDELCAVIFWLTGHTESSLRQMVEGGATVGDFFGEFPAENANAGLITGMVCGIRVEEISDPMTQRMRYLDKLVDELAKGKPLDKVLRG